MNKHPIVNFWTFCRKIFFALYIFFARQKQNFKAFHVCVFLKHFFFLLNFIVWEWSQHAKISWVFHDVYSSKVVLLNFCIYFADYSSFCTFETLIGWKVLHVFLRSTNQICVECYNFERILIRWIYTITSAGKKVPSLCEKDVFQYKIFSFFQKWPTLVLAIIHILMAFFCKNLWICFVFVIWTIIWWESNILESIYQCQEILVCFWAPFQTIFHFFSYKKCQIWRSIFFPSSS